MGCSLFRPANTFSRGLQPRFTPKLAIGRKLLNTTFRACVPIRENPALSDLETLTEDRTKKVPADLLPFRVPSACWIFRRFPLLGVDESTLFNTTWENLVPIEPVQHCPRQAVQFNSTCSTQPRYCSFGFVFAGGGYCSTPGRITNRVISPFPSRTLGGPSARLEARKRRLRPALIVGEPR